VVKVALVLGLAGAAAASAWQTVQTPAPAVQGATTRTPGPSNAAPIPDQTGVPVYAATIAARFPHDPTAFTEGLLFCDGALYESTGKEGASDIRRVTLATGKVSGRARLDPALFGEGIACWNKVLLSVTWKTGIGFRWSLPALKRTGTPLRYAGEGWGMTSDGGALILSDGTATLRRMDPATFAERGRIAVTMNGTPLKQLNELEYVRGRILANIWMTGFVARIDPATGKVDGLIDLRPIVAEIANADPDAVANGIAYDAASDRLFVTGKYWPTLFEIKLGKEVGRAR
jgi:glutamine cyclotransferase